MQESNCWAIATTVAKIERPNELWVRTLMTYPHIQGNYKTIVTLLVYIVK